jgi:sugar lactone lactonase YvrE
MFSRFAATLVTATAIALLTSGAAATATLTATAGTCGTAQGHADGALASAAFSGPAGVAADGSGGVVVADRFNHLVRRWSSSDLISTVAGGRTPGFVDAASTAARFTRPEGVAVTSASVVVVADTGNHAVRAISASGSVVTTLAGDRVAAFAEGAGRAALLNRPRGVAAQSSAAAFAADTENHRVRIIAITGGAVSTTAAGDGVEGFTDGVAGRLSFPVGLSRAAGGTLYIADSGNHAIRALSTTGVLSTIAGSGSFGSANGKTASFNDPRGIALDTYGSLLVADSSNGVLRAVALASNAVSYEQTFLDAPGGVAVASATAYYVTESSHNCIKRYTSAGAAGNGSYAPTNGSAPTALPAVGSTASAPKLSGSFPYIMAFVASAVALWF